MPGMAACSNGRERANPVGRRARLGPERSSVTARRVHTTQRTGNSGDRSVRSTTFVVLLKDWAVSSGTKGPRRA
jgi:hypothetical protein